MGTLEADFAAAAGPNNAAGATTGGNPQWPNSPEPWSKAFAPLAAKAVKNAIDGVLQDSHGELLAGAIAAPIAKAVSAYVGKAMAQLAEAAMGLELRSRLLWWKEACYSQSARCSYREIDVSVVPGLMAFDYQMPLPAIAPASVVRFLEETVRAFLGADHNKMRPLSEWIAELRRSPYVAPLEAVVKAVAFPEGRKPLLSALGDPKEPDVAIASLTIYTPERQLTAPDFARLIFLEFQALKAAAEMDAHPISKVES